MPEIKHNFTGGKMEKDLDERLIPNGQYRDAMNIQVSTSEGSDVGTVQNILGNSLVPGQGFIGDSAFCVGSIADEKNDKLYYFVTENKELIQNGNFDHGTNKVVSGGTVSTAENWTLGYDTGAEEGWEWSNQKIKGTSVPQNYKINQYLTDTPTQFGGIPTGDFIKDVFYEIKFTVSDSNGDSIALTLSNEDGERFYIGVSSMSDDGDYTFIRQLGSTNATTNPQYLNRLWIQAVGGGGFTGNIDNISIKRIGNYIIEYNSKTNSITPVLVDTTGEVLQFSPDRLITGINIIDDMLLWTDNYSEPKKINISRSIQGTSSLGTIHTKFINEAQDISDMDIREEHITVIKKSPKNAPTIELISERDSDYTYTGVMRITDGSDQSSLRTWEDWNAPWTKEPYGGPNDFSGIGIGHQFYTHIETAINGESGFTLDWHLGDIVVFKEFEDEQPPQVPITDYTIKAKIITPPTGSNIFTDSISELATNTDLIIPSPTGTRPAGYSWTSAVFSYNPANSLIEVTNAAWNKFVYSTPEIPFIDGGRYKVRFQLSGVLQNGGGIRLYIAGNSSFNAHDSNAAGAQPYWFTPMITSDGHHEFDLTLDAASAYQGSINYNNFTDQFFFRTMESSGGDNFTGNIENVSIEYQDATNARVALEVLDISGFPPTVPIGGGNTLRYAVDRLDEEEKLFEFKFPRFAYRYQYQDKEYSNISPFSPIAFIPGSFDYHPRKGYNLGMTNRLDKIKIKDFVTNVPNGVVAIDILYKEDVSPNIYVVDTIKPKHSALTAGGNIWYAAGESGEYVVSSELVKQTLPSNQILRPWDAVPRKALAQDVSGNRVIYGNYVQNYDLKYNDEDYYPDFSFTITPSDAGLNTVKSIKSLREYQLGVVFVDEYGRETPVITNTSGVSNVPKSGSSKENKINVSFNNEKFPYNMKYFKFFIKETSGEYYNMAMDRWYDAEDEHVWLSFPSSDRNKIDIDTFLILKKGLESNDLIEDVARYKVLAIENDAPKFIKTKKIAIDEKIHDVSVTSVTKDLFGNNVDTAPLAGRDTFKMKYRPFYDSTSSELHEIENEILYVEFGSVTGDYVSDRYRIASITTDLNPGTVEVADASYSVKLDRILAEDVDFMVNNVANPTYIKNTSTIKIYKYVIENSPRFDGRFFVKVVNDDTFANNVSTNDVRVPEFRTVSSRKLYFMSPNHIELHSDKLTGQNFGWYSDDATMWTTTGTYGQNPALSPPAAEWDIDEGTEVLESCHFGRFAPFFRNYNHKPGDFQVYQASTPVTQNSNTQLNNLSSYGFVLTDAGQYAFGDVDSSGNDSLDQKWKFELAYYTTPAYQAGTQSTGLDSGEGVAGHWIGSTVQSNWQFGYIHYSGPDSEDGLKFADSHGWSNTERDGKFNDKGEQTHGAVWFIDSGPYIGSRWGKDHLHWPYISQYPPAVPWNPGMPDGIQNGKMNISVNVYSPEVNSYADQSTNDIFGIGLDGSLTHHDTQYNRSLVNKMYPGQQWRWKDDPSGEVFTFQPTSAPFVRRLRYDADRTPWQTTNSHPAANWMAPPILITNTPPVPFTSVLSYDDQAQAREWLHHNGQPDALAQLSPNTTKGWMMNWENSNNSNTMAWDPTNSNNPGPIPNGLHLSINALTPGSGFTIAHNYVRVSTLEATCANHNAAYSISPGMILTSYDNGVVVLDGTLGGTYSYEPLIISDIVDTSGAGTGPYNVYLTGYTRPLTDNSDANKHPFQKHRIFFDSYPNSGEAMVFEQAAMNGYSQYSVNRINQQDANGDGWSITNPGILAVGYTIEFVEQIFKEPEMPNNPAIWETEPKESADLAIYYEASGLNPVSLSPDTMNIALPIGSIVKHKDDDFMIPDGVTIIGFEDDNEIILSEDILINSPYTEAGDRLRITRPDGSIIIVKIYELGEETQGLTNQTDTLKIISKIYGPDTTHILNWHNCYAFGNGVESNRIRDNFNLPFILNGVKASTTLEEGYNEEHRQYGLIYSGIYNGRAGVNNLNQFIMAERITKDINPIYGSIQKLHSRDTDLVALCEDKILRILANKDALFNADGNMQLTATENVLGQTVPFVGEFGISTNPESFASESYRAYFTDRVRGAVMRLSKDGLTPISMHGMKDWFRDNLSLGITNLLGEDNLSSEDKWDIPSTGNTIIGDGEAIIGGYNTDIHDSRYGKKASLRKLDILEIGKKYRLQYDIIEHSGLMHESTGEPSGTVIDNSPIGGDWISAGSVPESKIDGAHINVTWVANRTDFILMQFQVNQKYPDPGYYDGVPDSQTTTIQEWVNAARIADGWPDTNLNNIPDNNNYGAANFLYGGIVRVKNLVLEEVKEEPKLIGSYDDRQDEYNLTIHSANSTTVSFREDVTGWVSFKSFLPENAISCANDYYTVKNGKLWQHYSLGVDRNTFYNDGFVNSSVNVILNDMPGSMKSYHTLDYEGSQSRVEGIKRIDVDSVVYTGSPPQPDGKYFYMTDEEFYILLDIIDGSFLTTVTYPVADSTVDVKQYRNGILIKTGPIRIWNHPEGGGIHGSWHDGTEGEDDWEVGDIITTQLQEDSANHFNMTPKDGWYVSGIETNKQEGSLNEFIEKEGKWFNYIKGVDSEINETTDFGAFDIQGIGILKQTITSANSTEYQTNNPGTGSTTNIETYGWDWYSNKMQFDNPINASLQIGDIIYYQQASNINTLGGFNTMNPNEIVKFGQVTEITSNTVTVDETVFGSTNIPDPYHGAFIFFAKNQIINKSSLLGYFADIKFENNSKVKAELFSVGSEVNESSK